MTTVACLKLLINKMITVQSIQMCVAQSTRLISRILTCQTRFMVKKIDGYEGICSLVLVHIQLDLC